MQSPGLQSSIDDVSAYSQTAQLTPGCEVTKTHHDLFDVHLPSKDVRWHLAGFFVDIGGKRDHSPIWGGAAMEGIPRHRPWDLLPHA